MIIKLVFVENTNHPFSDTHEKTNTARPNLSGRISLHFGKLRKKEHI